MDYDNIYEWLYQTYYQPHAQELINSFDCADLDLDKAEFLLLTGGGGQIERQDALGMLRRVTGITAFAAGVRFSYHMSADANFDMEKA